jgi:hypothetical protein
VQVRTRDPGLIPGGDTFCTKVIRGYFPHHVTCAAAGLGSISQVWDSVGLNVKLIMYGVIEFLKSMCRRLCIYC